MNTSPHGVLWSDERLREELLRRYSGGSAGPRVLKFHVKRLAWTAVVRGTLVVKRALDVLGSFLLLVALAPLFLLVALVIRLESPGPVLFAQTRVGKWGRLFTMWKFRSMYVDAEARKAALAVDNEMKGGVTFKMKNDPRITRVGRFIRKGSIDELPQLWNVLRGDMSLVGPRPPVPKEVAEYTLADRRRLEAIPGITCIWQVSGRSDIPFKQQVELDAAYIDSQSLWLDVVLLLKTIPAVLLSRGAY
jgi:exopolysaccharide biosynthesis polyprenyl glycosylphosphotransferase